MIDTTINHSAYNTKPRSKIQQYAMTPAQLKNKPQNSSYVASVQDTAADTDLNSATRTDAMNFDPQSPSRYGTKKRNYLTTSVFKPGKKIMERDEG